MTNTEVPSTGGVLQSVKDRVNVDAVVEHISQSKDVLIEMAIYTLIGFFAGYLVKRYSSLLATMILLIGILIILGKIGIITVVVNWEYIYQQLGIQPVLLTSDNMASLGWEWMRANTLSVAGAVIGFFAGLRIG
jgi:uncharacterized membrane protein (Fun14 family)